MTAGFIKGLDGNYQMEESIGHPIVHKPMSEPNPTTRLYLDQIARGRDNNFTLIRFIAAAAVLVTHCFSLSTADPGTEPCRVLLGRDLGGMAVDVFFVTSGFLVAASLINRASLLDFFVARALRIYPGMWVMLIVTVFGIGPAFTVLPLKSYFLNVHTWRYLGACGSIIFGVAYRLPGVFVNNPWPDGIVNGALWSLPFEVRLYLGLALLWAICLFIFRDTAKAFIRTVQLLSVVCLAIYLKDLAVQHWASGNHRLAYFFLAGSCSYVTRRWVPMSRVLCGAGLAAIAATVGVAYAKRGTTVPFQMAYALCLPYVLLYLAYMPGGFIRQFNKVGDISYGLYIYGFPIQQAIIALRPGITTWPLLLLSAPTVILLASLSWYLIESPFLERKNDVLSFLRARTKRATIGATTELAQPV